MVLPGRIELTTSPLPRECSTTELRQHRAGAIHTYLKQSTRTEVTFLAIAVTAAQAAPTAVATAGKKHLPHLLRCYGVRGFPFMPFMGSSFLSTYWMSNGPIPEISRTVSPVAQA